MVPSIARVINVSTDEVYGESSLGKAEGKFTLIFLGARMTFRAATFKIIYPITQVVNIQLGCSMQYRCRFHMMCLFDTLCIHIDLAISRS